MGDDVVVSVTAGTETLQVCIYSVATYTCYIQYIARIIFLVPALFVGQPGPGPGPDLGVFK